MCSELDVHRMIHSCPTASSHGLILTLRVWMKQGRRSSLRKERTTFSAHYTRCVCVLINAIGTLNLCRLIKYFAACLRKYEITNYMFMPLVVLFTYSVPNIDAEYTCVPRPSRHRIRGTRKLLSICGSICRSVTKSSHM